jgi:UPF0755 protein
MKKQKIIKIVIAFILILIVVGLSFIGYNFGKKLFSENGVEEFPGTEIMVTIESGMGKEDVAETLQNAGVIENKIFL